MNSVNMPASYAWCQASSIARKIFSRMVLPDQKGMIFSRYTRRTSSLRRRRNLLAVVENLQVLQAVAAQLGIGRGRLGRRAFFADDQLAIVDADRLILHQVLEGQRPADGHRLRKGTSL